MSVDHKSEYVSSECSLRFDFDLIASDYDQWYSSVRGAVYDRIEKHIINKFLPVADMKTKLLDLGCGTGHWSEYFSGKGFFVTGIDVSERMINIARQKNIPNSDFQIADGQNLPFEDNSFDVAAAITVLEFAANPAKIISEMVRCVKKNGGIVIVGVLNILNSYNKKRINRGSGVYSNANMLAPKQVDDLLRQYGTPNVLVTGLVPENEWLLKNLPFCECAGKILHFQNGAFIAAKIIL